MCLVEALELGEEVVGLLFCLVSECSHDRVDVDGIWDGHPRAIERCEEGDQIGLAREREVVREWREFRRGRWDANVWWKSNRECGTFW